MAAACELKDSETSAYPSAAAIATNPSLKRPAMWKHLGDDLAECQRARAVRHNHLLASKATLTMFEWIAAHALMLSDFM